MAEIDPDVEAALHYEERQSNLQSKFQGTAKIYLRHLKFTCDKQNVAGNLHLDAKNVSRLSQIYHIEGCHRLDPANHIPALIGPDILERCLIRSGVSKVDLLRRHTPPFLELEDDMFLVYLHGRHRIAAALDYLLPLDKWWTVDLYSEDLSTAAQQEIREEYTNARNFCDGDIFRYLRYGQMKQDDVEEKRWLARLTECKRKDLKQLQKRVELKSFNTSLDKLLPFVGFWPALQIGTFHRILNLKCPEELESYLEHIFSIWNIILLNRPGLRVMVDFRTVQLLQCRCPGLDKVDAKFVTEQMSQRNLFPSIDDVPTRTQIQESLLRVPCLIPSLSTFFEDTKWLEPVAKVIRRLLPPSCKESNRRALFRKYTGLNYKRGTVQIQRRNQKWVHLSGDETQHMECGYRQLCSFAWRHFPELIAIAPRKDKGKERPQIKATNKQSWRKLAQLARSLGFDSAEIANLAEHNPDLAMVITFLGQVRPQEFYSQSKNGSSVNEICRILEGIEEQSSAIAVAEYLHADVPLEYRCGRPFEKAHESSRSGFFLFDLNSSFEDHLSHFVVQRDIFRAFFGSNFLPLFAHSQIQRGSISNSIPREPEASSSQPPRFNPPSCEFTSSSELHRSFSRPTKTPGRRGPVRRMNTIDETVTQKQHSLDTTVQSSLSDEQHEGQLPQVEESDLPDISTRNRDQATQQFEGQASERVNIDLQDQEQSFEEQTPEQRNIDSEVQESQEQASERVNINTQGERQVSPVSQEQIIEQSIQPSPKQAGDRRQPYTQTEEPVSHEPETRRELHDPAQPFTQTGDDEIDGLFNDDEAPHEKFTLPLGSQADGLPSSHDEQRGDVLTGKGPDQEFPALEMWRRWCHNGDWLLVDGQVGSAYHISAKDQPILKELIASRADQYYYAYYDELRGRLATVIAEKVCDWGKSEKTDGVIYLFKKDQEPRRSELGTVGFDTFKGANTEIRLKLIHAMREKNRMKRSFSEYYDPFECLNESDEGRRKRRNRKWMDKGF